MTTSHVTMPSPLGELTLVGDGETLAGLFFPGHRPPPAITSGRRDPGTLVETRAQLAQYFAGERTVFELGLAPRGTAFQLAVWERMCAIPHGQTRTYAELARELSGAPPRSGTVAPRLVSPRAVGGASAHNPVSIVIPCHRMLGSSGALTGYAGGLDRKRALLVHEGALPSEAV